MLNVLIDRMFIHVVEKFLMTGFKEEPHRPFQILPFWEQGKEMQECLEITRHSYNRVSIATSVLLVPLTRSNKAVYRIKLSIPAEKQLKSLPSLQSKPWETTGT